MPVVSAYKATVNVSARQHGEDANFYQKTITVYGETPGETVDNMVKASVELANSVFEWLVQNKPADYRLSDDYWSVYNTHPNFLKTDMTDLKSREARNDSGSGSSISEIVDIVRHVVLFRDIEINFAVNHLALAQTGSTNMQREPASAYEGSYGMESFEEITKYGWSGEEFDAILSVAEEEGRLQAFRQMRSASYKAYEQNRLARVRAADREERRQNKKGFLSKIFGS